MAFIGSTAAPVGPHYYSQERPSQLTGKRTIFRCIDIGKAFTQSPIKKTKAKLAKERRRQFSIWYFEQEQNKEKEQSHRRQVRKKIRTLQIQDAGRQLYLLYALDFILWIIGGLFTLCSAVKHLGQYTAFYRYRKLYIILGPIILVVAILVLFLAAGLKHRIKKKHRRQRKFHVLEKQGTKGKENGTKDPDKDSGNEEDIEMCISKKFKDSQLQLREEKEIGTDDCACQRAYDGSEENLLENAESDDDIVEELESDDPITRAFRSRRDWAKTKWMRIEEDSDESFELENLKKYKHGVDSEEINTVVSEKGETSDNNKQSREADVNKRSSRSRIMRGCLKQSSTKSQASTISNVSTVSESAPLVESMR